MSTTGCLTREHNRDKMHKSENSIKKMCFPKRKYLNEPLLKQPTYISYNMSFVHKDDMQYIENTDFVSLVRINGTMMLCGLLSYYVEYVVNKVVRDKTRVCMVYDEETYNVSIVIMMCADCVYRGKKKVDNNTLEFLFNTSAERMFITQQVNMFFITYDVSMKNRKCVVSRR